MKALVVYDSFFGNTEQIAQVIGQALAGFKQYVLNDIAGVDAARESLIETRPNHASERLTMPVEQPIDGRGRPPFRLAHQFLCFRGIGPHAD